jgi:hypothetical protein
MARRSEMKLASRRDEPVTCASCGRKVERKMRGQRFCSARCRQGHSRAREPHENRERIQQFAEGKNTFEQGKS